MLRSLEIFSLIWSMLWPEVTPRYEKNMRPKMGFQNSWSIATLVATWGTRQAHAKHTPLSSMHGPGQQGKEGDSMTPLQ